MSFTFDENNKKYFLIKILQERNNSAKKIQLSWKCKIDNHI